MKLIDENDPIPYLRVGNSYYLSIKQPGVNGEKNRLSWFIDTIRQDHTKGYIEKIPKYFGFTVEPNHIDYQEVIDNFLNEYHPLPFQPKKGSCETVLRFLNHIFEEHYEYILDYFSILYKYPRQKLPIILLVSIERNTGKTSFLKLCKAIFGANCTYNDNNSYKSQFNSDWVNALLVVNDESDIGTEEVSSRLKNSSTASEVKVESKGKDKVPKEFFGKFILCSNKEDRPVIIEAGETRYWVRKVKVFEESSWIDEIADKMKPEIPAFLFFLSERKISTKNESRMWFNPELLKTTALERIIRYSKPKLELELAIVINEIIEDKELVEFHATIENLLGIIGNSNLKADRSSIKKILCDSWHLAPAKNSLTYTAYAYSNDGYLFESKQIGRYYTITKDFIKTKI